MYRCPNAKCGRYPLKIRLFLLNKTSNGCHQATHNILLAHFEYLDSKNKNRYPVDPDICFSSTWNQYHRGPVTPTQPRKLMKEFSMGSRIKGLLKVCVTSTEEPMILYNYQSFENYTQQRDGMIQLLTSQRSPLLGIVHILCIFHDSCGIVLE